MILSGLTISVFLSELLDLTELPQYSTLSYTWGHSRTPYRSDEDNHSGTGHEQFMPVF
jgi:hypothetical protein